MKRLIGTLLIIWLSLTGCGAADLDIELTEVPKYKAEKEFPIALFITDGKDAVTDVEVTATLEMARMDHGVIEVVFSDDGDGMFSGEVVLPMAGEWFANLVVTGADSTYEEIITFDVKEE